MGPDASLRRRGGLCVGLRLDQAHGPTDVGIGGGRDSLDLQLDLIAVRIQGEENAVLVAEAHRDELLVKHFHLETARRPFEEGGVPDPVAHLGSAFRDDPQYRHLLPGGADPENVPSCGRLNLRVTDNSHALVSRRLKVFPPAGKLGDEKINHFLCSLTSFRFLFFGQL